MSPRGVYERRSLFGHMEILVDDADTHLLANHTWTISRYGSTFYAYRQTSTIGGTPSRKLYLHREVLNAPDGVNVDHINGNGLDCRRSNLRLADQTLNNANARPRVGTSRFKGVYFDRSRGKWSARIQSRGRQSFLGRFDSEEEAALAYDAAASVHFGQFARLNFPKRVA